MKSEISEIKRAVSVICANEMRARRGWSNGQRTSRTDVGIAPGLTTAMVDAVFEEETVNFVNAGQDPGAEKTAEPKVMVESLAAQLAILENQCSNLRRLLDMASADPR